jgi:hypothetical protein
MAIREDEALAYLQNFNQSIAQAGGDLAQLRKQMEFQQAADQLPGLIQQGDLGGVASLAFRAGDGGPLRELIQGQLANQKAALVAKPSLGVPQLQSLAQAQGISLDQAGFDTLSKLPAEQQLSQINAIGTRQTAQNQQRMADQDRNEGIALRKDESIQRQAEKFTNYFEKQLSKLNEDQQAVINAKSAFDQGSTAGDSAMIQFLVRRVGGEKGPLTDADIDRFKAKAFQNDVNAYSNFLSGGTASTLTPAQREAFNELYTAASGNFNKYRTETLGGILNQSRGTYSKLYENGQPSEAVIEAARRAGYEPRSANGRTEFVSAAQKSTVPGVVKDDGGQRIDVASLMTLANSIEDPVRRKQALDALQARPPQDQAKAQAWAERLKQFGAK